MLEVPPVTVPATREVGTEVTVVNVLVGLGLVIVDVVNEDKVSVASVVTLPVVDATVSTTLPVVSATAVVTPPTVEVTISVGAVATVVTAARVVGTMATVPPTLGTAVSRSERICVLLDTAREVTFEVVLNKSFATAPTVLPVELRRLFTAVVASVRVFDATGPTIGSAARVPLTVLIAPPLRFALGSAVGSALVDTGLVGINVTLVPWPMTRFVGTRFFFTSWSCCESMAA